MNKPLKENLQYDIDALINIVKASSFSNDVLTSQIMSVLNSTYELITLLEEKRTLNSQIEKFEHDNTSVEPYINRYKKLLDIAKENEDKNLIWKYEYAIGFFENIKKNTTKMLYMQKMIIFSNILLEDEDFYNIYMNFLKKNDVKNYNIVIRNFKNKDLFVELYGLFEGYKLSKKKILKSAGLKIFNFFQMTTKVQKKALATQIEYIFASLGENISINPKRASNIKPISDFNNNIIVDYSDNKKDNFVDKELHNILMGQLLSTIKQVEQAGYKDLASSMKDTITNFEELFLTRMLN